MLEINKSIGMFKTKEIWFAEYPFDIEGYDCVTFCACPNKLSMQGFAFTEFSTLVIDLGQSLDSIWTNMHKDSCRYQIRRAIREGVKVRTNRDYDIFLQIHRSFVSKKGIRATPVSSGFMQRYGVLFVAEYDGEILGGQFHLKDEQHMRYQIGGSLRLDSDPRKAKIIGLSNRLLMWEAIKYAKDHGVREFDFGGIWTGAKIETTLVSTNLFKESFGGKLTRQFFYKRYHSHLLRLSEFLYLKITEQVPWISHVVCDSFAALQV